MQDQGAQLVGSCCLVTGSTSEVTYLIFGNHNLLPFSLNTIFYVRVQTKILKFKSSCLLDRFGGEMLSLHFHHCYHHQLYLYHQGFEADGTEWGWPELHLRPVGRALALYIKCHGQGFSYHRAGYKGIVLDKSSITAHCSFIHWLL